jgi:hypothetical protein
MELMKIVKSEEVEFGLGFVPVLGFFFTGTENEFERIQNLNKSGEIVRLAIDPMGEVTFDGDGI